MRKHSEHKRDILEELLNSRPEAFSTGETYRLAAQEIIRLRKECQEYKNKIEKLKSK